VDQYQKQNPYQTNVNYQKGVFTPNNYTSGKESITYSNDRKYSTSTLAYNYKNDRSFISWLWNLISKLFTKIMKTRYGNVTTVRIIYINTLIYGTCIFIFLFPVRSCCPAPLKIAIFALFFLLIEKNLIEKYRTK
jgi:hypothetical protein